MTIKKSLKTILKKFREILNINFFANEVLQSTSKALFIKILGLCSSLAVSVILGRNLGSEGLGLVNFTNQVALILLVLTMFGFENSIIKFIAIGKGERNYKLIFNTLRSALMFNGVLSFVVTIFGLTSLYFSLEFFEFDEKLFLPLSLIFITILPHTLSRVYSSALNGFGRIWQANLVNNTLTTILVLVGLIIFDFYDFNYSPFNIIFLYCVNRLILTFVVALYWKKSFKFKFDFKSNLSLLFRTAKPMMIVSSSSVLISNSDVIILGLFGDFKELGVYTVTTRLAYLTSFILQVTNSAISPKLASLFHKNELIEMEKMIQLFSRILLFIGLSFLLIAIVFGEVLLGVWGSEFEKGYSILIVLSFGQLFNIGTGSSGMVLLMSGLERIHGRISLITLIFNLILNVILINFYGIYGAAVASASTVIISNIMKVRVAKNKLGVLTIPKLNL